MQLTESLTSDDSGWVLTETGWNRDRSVAVGSNLLCGNGYLGYRGTTPEQRATDYVALVVSDTYDCADGQWEELTTAPNPLFVAARVDDRQIGVATADDVVTSLDLRTGEFRARFATRIDGATISVEVERIASYDQLQVLAQRWTLSADANVDVVVEAGIDGGVWSLNGTHLPTIEFETRGPVTTASGVTAQRGTTVAVALATSVSEPLEPESPVVTESASVQRWQATLRPGVPLVVESIAAIVSSNDPAIPDDSDAVEHAAALASSAGSYDTVRSATVDQWAMIWGVSDVVIDGPIVDQVALRFSTYHNRICTPAHADHLPIGARGLSCQAYQGAAFWDQEIYNLPAFLFTEPEIARSLLVYRHRTLDGARRKASRLGYDGAFYAWISGVTGDELCPDYFFEDVLTGRPIRNHFNIWQMHVAPDVVATIARYVEVTGDIAYLVDYGAEIAFEVARFLRSFVRYNDWLDTYHCIRLLGPDEWHENVDDNAFTNYQTKAALDFAVQTFDRLVVDRPEALHELASRLALTPDEVDRWRAIAEKLMLPSPDPETNLIEQFRGFFQLEDVGPREVAERLLHPEEYWGWPNGVAVATQVSKQADVAMLLWQQADRFPLPVKRANYDYYEPRCSHASSLSHAAFGMVAIEIGEVESALAHFRSTATVDLLNANHAVVGGTFIGGLHTAACGGTYQLAVQGFGGLGFEAQTLVIDPLLPSEWTALTYPVSWRGQRLTVRVEHDRTTLSAANDNDAPVSLRHRNSMVELEPGQQVVADIDGTLVSAPAT